MSDDKQRDPQHGGRAPGRGSAGIGETDARGVGPDAPSLAATADRTVPDRPADVGRRIRRPERSRMPDDPSSQPGFKYRNTVYLDARKEAFARSGDLCQLCGQQPAVEAHHWAVDYPPAHKTTAADLTALCAECHFVATTLRRFTRAGGSRHQFRAVLSEVIARCDLNSPLPASPPSSCTTEYPCCQGPDRGKGSSASGGESVHSGPGADLYVRWSNVAADPNVTSGERTYRQGSARPCAGLRWPRPANPASGQSLHLPSALYVVHPLWRTRRICTVIDIEVVSQYANAADVTTAQRDVPLRALQARAPTTIVQPPSTLSQLLA